MDDTTWETWVTFVHEGETITATVKSADPPTPQVINELAVKVRIGLKYSPEVPKGMKMDFLNRVGRK